MVDTSDVLLAGAVIGGVVLLRGGDGPGVELPDIAVPGAPPAPDIELPEIDLQLPQFAPQIDIPQQVQDTTERGRQTVREATGDGGRMLGGLTLPDTTNGNGNGNGATIAGRATDRFQREMDDAFRRPAAEAREAGGEFIGGLDDDVSRGITTAADVISGVATGTATGVSDVGGRAQGVVQRAQDTVDVESITGTDPRDALGQAEDAVEEKTRQFDQDVIEQIAGGQMV